MNVKNFVLSYYKNATSNMHIQIVKNSMEAQKPHTHDYYQIYYIIKGSVENFTEVGSSLLFQGDMVITPPKSMHFIKQSENSEFFSFSFTAQALEKIRSGNKLANDYISWLNNEKNVLTKVTLKDSEALSVENVLMQTVNEFNQKSVAYEEVMRCYLNLLITTFARKHLESDGATKVKILYGYREQIKHSIQYVKQNYAENFSLKEMAQYSALSVSVFCKVFKEISGCTFNEYLNKTRISVAKKLIEQEQKITIVCGLVGYKDFSTFYRNFKKITGCSPEKYLYKHKTYSRF